MTDTTWAWRCDHCSRLLRWDDVVPCTDHWCHFDTVTDEWCGPVHKVTLR